MAHEAKIIEKTILSDGALGIRMRCCDDQTSDAWHTVYVQDGHCDKTLASWAEERRKECAAQHAKRERMLEVLGKL